MKKIYFLALSMSACTLFAQNNDALLKGFDEQKLISEAKRKGVSDEEIKGYIIGQRAKFLHQENPLLKPREKNVSEKITLINMSRLSNQSVQTNYCPNVDFAMLNYNNWTGDISNTNSLGTQFPIATWTGTGFNGNNGSPILINTDPCQAATVASDRHVVMSIPTGVYTNNIGSAFGNGFDPTCQNPITGLFDLPVVPPGGNSSIRIGSAYPQYTSEKVVYAISPTSSSSLFTYKFAIVIVDGSHGVGEQAAFTLILKDGSGNPIGGSCGAYQIDATMATTDTTFIKTTSTCINALMTTYYRKWETRTIDLSAFIGQTVYIEFQSLDCIYSGHFCYAYLWGSCQPFQATINMCTNSNLQQLIAPLGYSSYQWYDPFNNPVGTNDTLSITNGNVGDIYKVDMMTSVGCFTSLNVTLQYSALQILYNGSVLGTFAGSGNINLCNGSSVNLVAQGANTYTWSANTGNSMNDSVTVTPSNSSLSYSVVGNGFNGCIDTSYITFTLDSSGCVWPGDADENLIVDNLDLLPVGLKWGQTGPSRAFQSSSWYGFSCNDWVDTLSNGTNVKYSDCNGSGLIEYNDTLAINFNYGSTHLQRQTPPKISDDGVMDVYLQFNKSLYHAGDTLLADVMMGSNAVPQTNFYGGAFTINYDEPQVKTGSENFYFNNSWVGNINVDQIKFSKIFPVSGYVDASLVRITHTNQNGFGKIAQLKLILKDTVTANWLYFTTSNAIKIDNAGINNSLNSGTDSVAVVAGVGVKQFVNNVNHIIVFPNPSAGSFAVNCSKNIDEIKITDILGNIIYGTKPNAQKVNLQIEEAGVYFVTITNGKESTVRKVIVNK